MNNGSVFDRLNGSRVALGNFELRYPLIRPAQLAPVESNSLGVTLSAFLGLAWWSFDRPKLDWKRYSLVRIPVTSTGLSSRFNIGSVIFLEAFYAYPFQHLFKGGHTGLVLSPAW